MKLKYLLLPITVCFFSCTKENVKEEYYSDGSLRLRAEINEKGLYNGLYEEFYKKGNIKSSTQYKAGVISDTVFFYHKNGKIESKGFSKKYLPIGWWSYYNIEGKINEKKEILMVDGKSYLNQIIRYDSQGKIDYKNSSFFELEIKDTLVLGGNKGEVIFHLDTIGFQDRYIRIIVNNQYSDSLIKKDTFVGERDKNWFGIYNHKTGNKVVSGVIEEQLVFPNNIRITTKYFERKIYVKNK